MIRNVTAIIRFEDTDGSVEFMEMFVTNWEQHRELQKVYELGRIVDFIPGPTTMKLEGVLKDCATKMNDTMFGCRYEYKSWPGDWMSYSTYRQYIRNWDWEENNSCIDRKDCYNERKYSGYYRP